jgi:hypothetical protein
VQDYTGGESSNVGMIFLMSWCIVGIIFLIIALRFDIKRRKEKLEK